jgi:hypothetical protein
LVESVTRPTIDPYSTCPTAGAAASVIMIASVAIATNKRNLGINPPQAVDLLTDTPSGRLPTISGLGWAETGGRFSVHFVTVLYVDSNDKVNVKTELQAPRDPR